MAEFAASRHGVVLRSQAASFGLTAPELRVAKERGWLTEPARGVLVVSGYPATWEQRLAIATAAGTAEPVVSNGAGGRLFALDSFASADGELTVLRPGRIPTSVSGGIVVHHTTVLDLCSANSPSQPNVAAADRPSSSSARPGRHGAAARLGIEGQSREFHSGPVREAADEDRDLRVAACGWELIYLGWYAQRCPAEVVQQIAEVCQARIGLRSA